LKISLSRISDASLEDLITGFLKVLRFYQENGIGSFNAAIFSGLGVESEKYFRVSMRIVARYGYKPRFVSDIWALQYLFGEREVSESPEETCIRLRNYVTS
jgi:hypothetical protein